MKLGVSYNVFDGEELLEGSIKQIRGCVDYISVVYQVVSNVGNECRPGLFPLLQRLKDETLIDACVKFDPVLKLGRHENELRKRNLGLELSRAVQCTHHMSMDTDEYYNPEEFERIKAIVTENEYDAVFCQMQSYYKTWQFVRDPPETYYVSMMFAIGPDSRYVHGAWSPVLVDPTRRMSPVQKPIVCLRDQIQMHHGSYIRDDLPIKLTNSSAASNWQKRIHQIAEYHRNWVWPSKAMWGTSMVTLKKLDAPIF